MRASEEEPKETSRLHEVGIAGRTSRNLGTRKRNERRSR